LWPFLSNIITVTPFSKAILAIVCPISFAVSTVPFFFNCKEEQAAITFAGPLDSSNN
jgi:hypothetical protein